MMKVPGSVIVFEWQGPPLKSALQPVYDRFDPDALAREVDRVNGQTEEAVEEARSKGVVNLELHVSKIHREHLLGIGGDAIAAAVAQLDKAAMGYI